MSGLNLGLIKETKLKRPPIELQDEFSAIHNEIDEVKSRYQQSLTDLESLYSALSQKAFKGELDLSRVPLPVEGAEIAEDGKPDTEEKQYLKPFFELPAPADLAAPQTTEGRKTLLGEWLTAWLEQPGDILFDAQSFMEAARQRLWDAIDAQGKDTQPIEYDEVEFRATEYDELKDRIFEALEQGRLAQIYGDAYNRVQITTAKG